MKKALLGIFFLSLPLFAQTSNMVAGYTYETLDSEHIRLRYPKVAEKEARDFLGRAETFVKTFEKEAGFKYGRRIVTYLTDRRFQNAYVTGQIVGVDLHILLPLKLIYSDFYLSGMDGSAYDVFVHEVAHHMQLERGRYMFSKFFGPTIPFDFIAVPSWIWEGYAVYMESTQRPYKGRLKSSYFDSLLGSTLEHRKALHSFDLYAGNRDWRTSGGSQYLMGSEFMGYLGRTYGDPALHKFVDRSMHFTFSSDFHTAFNKSFHTLWEEFEAEQLKRPARQRPAQQKAIFSNEKSRISGLARFPNNNTAFIASSEKDEAYLYLVDAQGKELERHTWAHILESLYSRDIDVPNQMKALSDNRHLAFLAYANSLDGVAQDGVLARVDAEGGGIEILKDVPTAVAADFNGDASKAWIVTQDRNEMAIVALSNNLETSKKILSLPPDISQVSSLSISKDEQTALISAFKDETWNIYTLDLRQGTLKTLVKTAAQEINAVWDASEKNVYFLTDLDGHFNVASVAADGSSKDQLCYATQAPWLVNQFALGANGIVHSNRENRFYTLDETQNLKNCRKTSEFASAKTEAPLSAEEKPADVSQVKPYSETFLKTFVPVTRLVLPFWDSKDGFGVQALLAGESPYKKVVWQLSGNYQAHREDEAEGTLQIVDYHLHPTMWGFMVDSTAGYLRTSTPYNREARYTTYSLLSILPLYNHQFVAGFHARDTKRKQTQGGYSITHLFQNGVSSIRAAGPKRGLLLSNHAAFFPSGLKNDEALNLQRFEQTVYLPLIFSSKHSFKLSATELLIQPKSGKNLGLITGGQFVKGLGGDRAQLSLDATRSDASIQVKGFGDVDFRGNKAIYGLASYTIPLYEADFGGMNALNRIWFNPRFTSLKFGPFINGARFIDARATNTEWHVAAGLEVQAGVSLIDFLPLVIMYQNAKRLTDDKGWDSAILFGVSFGG